MSSRAAVSNGCETGVTMGEGSREHRGGGCGCRKSLGSELDRDRETLLSKGGGVILLSGWVGYFEA